MVLLGSWKALNSSVTLGSVYTFNALDQAMALQGHPLAGGGHQHQLSGLQGEFRLGIGHSAGACLGHKSHKGIGTGQVKGLGAIHTDGLHIAAVVESVLIHQLGTDGGGIVHLVKAELEGEFLPEHLGPVVAHQLGAVLDEQRTDGVATLALAVGERQGAHGSGERLALPKGIGILQQLAVGDYLHAPAPQLFLKQYTNL